MAKDKVHNPHDKYFKDNFSRRTVVEDFLKNYLPKDVRSQIDLKSLRLEKDRFVDKNLKETHSDMIYSTLIDGREGFLYFLFEHKSYVEKDTLFQLMKYMVDIWQSVLKEGKNEIPVIIPIVIFAGNSNWKAKTRLSDMIMDYDTLPDTIKKYVPDYEYPLYDLLDYSVDEMKGSARLRIMTIAFEHVFQRERANLSGRDVILKAGEYLRKLEDQQEAMDCFLTFKDYLVNEGETMTSEEMQSIAKELKGIYSKGSEIIMSTAEKIREEGMLEGMTKGRLEGNIEGKADTLIKQLLKRFKTLPKGMEEEIKQMSASKLDMMIIEIFEYESIEDVKKWLQ